jgi:uncharacterized membrane protein
MLAILMVILGLAFLSIGPLGQLKVAEQPIISEVVSEETGELVEVEGLIHVTLSEIILGFIGITNLYETIPVEWVYFISGALLFGGLLLLFFGNKTTRPPRLRRHRKGRKGKEEGRPSVIKPIPHPIPIQRDSKK